MSLFTRCFGVGASNHALMFANVEAFNTTVLSRDDDIVDAVKSVMNNAALTQGLPNLKLLLNDQNVKLQRHKQEEYISFKIESIVHITKSDKRLRSIAIVTEEIGTVPQLKCHIFRLQPDSKNTAEDVYGLLEKLFTKKELSVPLDQQHLVDQYQAVDKKLTEAVILTDT